MQCAVEFSVAAAVEPVADRLARGGRDWRRAGEACKGRLGADPSLVRPGEHELCGRMRSNTWLVEQLRGELASDRFDLACELAFLSGQLQHPPGDRAQRQQASAELGVASSVRPSCCEALQKPCTCQRPQLAAQRLRGYDQQVSQLAEAGALGVDRAFACGHQGL